MIPRRPAVLAILVFFCLSPALLWARPPHKKAMADYFGPFFARKLNDCRTCHVPPKPGEKPEDFEEDKPHNLFGARIQVLRGELKKVGQKTTIPGSLEAVGKEDSDGDGVTNMIELITGHNPGEKEDKPSPQEIDGAPSKLAAFDKYRQSYPWLPFETVKRSVVPAVKNTAWVRNPIDAFVSAEHEAQGLRPRPEASKHVLLRRLYLDLIGLPPTPDELHVFLNDPAPDAYEKVVDRLLADPRYGERWGRHWMDVWRYSDWAGWTDGGQIRDSQPHIWRWRDWIIESLNQDKPYDRMVQEMLAADELCPEDTNAIRATGFLVRNYKMLSREKWLQDTVEHTFLAFQAVTINCARCHEHMFDTIEQKEYYRVRAIFEPHQVRMDRVPGQLDTKLDGLPRAYDADLAAKTFLFIRGDDRTPDKDHPIEPGVPELLGGKFPKIEPVSLPKGAYDPDRREFVTQEMLAANEMAVAKARQARESILQPASNAFQTLADVALKAKKNLGSAESTKTAEELKKAWEAAEKSRAAVDLAELDILVAQAKQIALVREIETERLESAGKKDSEAWKKAAAETATLQRNLSLLEARRNLFAAQSGQEKAADRKKKQADPDKKIQEAEKALAKAEAEAKKAATTDYKKRDAKTYSPVSSGRRLAFARWLTNRENPLTARVAMNHIWLRHFGQPIVPSVFDFGHNGRLPSHPALLDWLAIELMERGWSMKAMHRLIVTSNTYRMASTPDESCLKVDPDNRYLWRMNFRRMEAEVVRDSIFYMAGNLDLKMGGPEIDQNRGLTVPRRSIYFRHAQEKQMEFMKIFDTASVTECYQRKESVLPQQALALANSELTVKHARLLARSLAMKIGPDAATFTTAAFEQVLSRPPTREELLECSAFLQQQTQKFGVTNQALAATPTDGSTPAAEPALRAKENLVHVLMNHNDFVTIR